MPQTNFMQVGFNKMFVWPCEGIFLDTLPLYLWRVDNQSVLWA